MLPAAGIVRRAGESRASRGTPLMATILVALFAVLVVRMVAFVAHAPMLGYGNNWDQVRYTACLHVFPHAPDVQPPGTASPDRPPVTATLLPDVQGPCIWTSDIAFDAFARAWLGAVPHAGDAPATMPVRAVGWARVVVALFALGFVTWRLWRQRPALACGYAAALAIVLGDPAALLWINTFYAEFTAVTAVLVGIGALLATGCGARGVGLGLVQFVAALALAMAKVQYGSLALALWLGAAIALWLSPRRVGVPALPFLAGALLGLAGQLVQLARDDGDMRLWRQVTIANTVMNAVLAASDDASRTTATLGLPAHCAALAGSNWFTTPVPYAQSCPEVFALGRGEVLWRLARHEPGTLVRLGALSLQSLDPWVQRELGHVAGEPYGDATATRFSFSGVLERHTPLAWAIVFAPIAFVVVGLVARRWRVAGRFGAWMGAWLGCAVIGQQLVITTLGDGVHDLSRQAFLVYGAALFWLVATIAGGLSRLLMSPRDRAEEARGVR